MTRLLITLTDNGRSVMVTTVALAWSLVDGTLDVIEPNEWDGARGVTVTYVGVTQVTATDF